MFKALPVAQIPLERLVQSIKPRRLGSRLPGPLLRAILEGEDGPPPRHKVRQGTLNTPATNLKGDCNGWYNRNSMGSCRARRTQSTLAVGT